MTKLIVAFTCGVLVGVVGYALGSAFGPGATNLIDPFEEHEE